LLRNEFLRTPDLSQFIIAGDVFVRIEIGNDGATNAFEVEASIECFVGQDRAIAIPKRPFRYFVGVIGAEQSDHVNAEHTLSCSQADFGAVRNGNLKFWMHSVVSYVDIFNQGKTFANESVFHPFPTASEPVIDWNAVESTVHIIEEGQSPPIT
jgi:hypothetical protein